MISPNILSNTWKMGLHLKRCTNNWENYATRRPIFPHWQSHFCRQSHAGKRTFIQLVVQKTLQTELLHWCHDHFTSGQLGLNKTYERLRFAYFWNNMFADLQCWIKSCVFCAQKESHVHHSKPSLLPIAFSGLWEVITANCMGPLSVTNLDNWYIRIIGDLSTKYIETATLPSIEIAIEGKVFLDKTV